MKRKPASVQAYEQKILELQGKVESLARDLGKLNEATEDARRQRSIAAREEDALRLLTIERKHDVAVLDAQIAERKEVLVRNVKQAEGSVAVLLIRAATEEQHLKTLQEAQKKYDSIHLAGQDAKRVHEAILGEIEASKQTLHAIRGQVSSEQAKLDLIKKEEADAVKNVADKMNTILRAGEALKENIERMKFYGKRLKKHLMALNLPFPDDLADFSGEKVFYKKRELNEQHGKQ